MISIMNCAEPERHVLLCEMFVVFLVLKLSHLGPIAMAFLTSNSILEECAAIRAWCEIPRDHNLVIHGT